MQNKIYKPYTPSLRTCITQNFSLLSKKKPEKSLLAKNTKSYGRNNQGKITVRHIGGGHKQRYRIIDFKRNKYNLLGKIVSIEYDPNRNSFISLVYYEDGTKNYILYPNTLLIGNNIISNTITDINIGNTLILENIPIGTEIHNIELYPKKGGQLIRAAGTYATVVARETGHVIIKLPSKEIRAINDKCSATIGRVGNSNFYNTSFGKAGRSRWRGIRPSVRGSAMNPIDHPHGGGEGKSPIGRKSPMSPWGKPTFGVKTRKKKKPTNKFIIHI